MAKLVAFHMVNIWNQKSSPLIIFILLVRSGRWVGPTTAPCMCTIPFFSANLLYSPASIESVTSSLSSHRYHIISRILFSSLTFLSHYSLSQEVLMGRANYFSSFKQNADQFICSTLPGISHPQVQYSPGKNIHFFTFL